MTFKAKKPQTGTGYFLPTLSICLALFGLVALSDGQGCLDGNCSPRTATWGHYEPQWRRWPGATTYQGYKKPMPAVSVPEPKVPDAINETRSSELTRSDRPLDPEDIPAPMVPGVEGEDPFSNTVDESDIPAGVEAGGGGDVGAGGDMDGGFQPPGTEAIPEPAAPGGGMFDNLPGNDAPAPAGDGGLFPAPAGDGGNTEDDADDNIFGDSFNLDSRAKSPTGDQVVTRPIPIPLRTIETVEVPKRNSTSEFSYADLTLAESTSGESVDGAVQTVSYEQDAVHAMPKLAEASNVSVSPVGQSSVGEFDVTANSIASRNPLRNRPRLRAASTAKTAPPQVTESFESIKTTRITQEIETNAIHNLPVMQDANLGDIVSQQTREIEVAQPTELEAVTEMPQLVEANAVDLRKLPQPKSRSLVASARRPLRETLRKNPLR